MIPNPSLSPQAAPARAPISTDMSEVLRLALAHLPPAGAAAGLEALFDRMEGRA